MLVHESHSSPLLLGNKIGREGVYGNSTASPAQYQCLNNINDGVISTEENRGRKSMRE